MRIDSLLRKGTNQVSIVVTNTLANAIFDPEALAIWKSRTPDAFWNKMKGGIWDGIAREYEKESLASGLMGPVKVLVQ